MSFRAFPALYLTIAIRQVQILLVGQILLLLVPDWAWPLSGFLWQSCGKVVGTFEKCQLPQSCYALTLSHFEFPASLMAEKSSEKIKIQSMKVQAPKGPGKSYYPLPLAMPKAASPFLRISLMDFESLDHTRSSRFFLNRSQVLELLQFLFPSL